MLFGAVRLVKDLHVKIKEWCRVKLYLGKEFP